MSKEIAERFRRMADLIEKNQDEDFGGAAVIVPPRHQSNQDLKSIEILKLDPAPDAAIFWGEIRSRSDEAVADLTNQIRQMSAFKR
jgi:hypothetical protein